MNNNFNKYTSTMYVFLYHLPLSWVWNPWLWYKYWTWL